MQQPPRIHLFQGYGIELEYMLVDRDTLPGGPGHYLLDTDDLGYSIHGLGRTFANGLVDAGVCYYGGGIQNALDKADKATVPLLMHFGGKDSHWRVNAWRSFMPA